MNRSGTAPRTTLLVLYVQKEISGSAENVAGRMRLSRLIRLLAEF